MPLARVPSGPYCSMSENAMGILAKRRAQAEVIKPIYEDMKAELGVETAQRILGTAIKEAAIAEGRLFAQREPDGPSLERFAALRPLWMREDALTIETLDESPDRLAYNVTRCRYAEMYRDMGLQEIGHLLSCNRDASFCEGYDPRMKLTRTQTIMQGASYCDFRYRLDGGTERT